jgi:hypothetical protein
VKGHGAKGFVCRLTHVKRVDRVRALQRPLNSGLTFSVNHSSAAVGNLLTDVPYELIREKTFVFILLSNLSFTLIVH